LRPKRDEITGEWRKLHNEKLSDPYSLKNIIRVMKSSRIEWVGHVACNVEGRVAYGVLVVKSERKIPLGRPRRRWEDNMKQPPRLQNTQELAPLFICWVTSAYTAVCRKVSAVC
jgi:hypothetical protein